MKMTQVLLILTLCCQTALADRFGTDPGQPDTIRVVLPSIAPYPDSMAVPIYIWNDEPVGAFTLGFTSVDECELISSVSTTGGVIPTAPAGSFYVTYRPDLHAVLTGWIEDFSTISPIPASPTSKARLLLTLYVRYTSPGCEHHFRLDSTFVPPAGSFVLVAASGFKPQFVGQDVFWDGVENNPGSGADQLPVTPTLDQNVPNPFNASTAITFNIPRPSNVQLDIINVLGENVTTLIKGAMSRGEQKVVWDGRDRFGALQPSGVYFYRMSSGSYVEIKKMILLK
jgi:hypothetical protein